MHPFLANIRSWRALTLVAAAALLWAMPGSAAARASCTLSFGFAALQAQIPEIVGACAEVEQVDPATGNITQRTEHGVLTWRKADNWTAFSDGPNTYILHPEGVATRSTDGPLFPWEPVRAAGSPAGGGQSPASAGGAVLFAETFDDAASPFCREIARWTRFSSTPRASNGSYGCGGIPGRTTCSP